MIQPASSIQHPASGPDKGSAPKGSVLTIDNSPTHYLRIDCADEAEALTTAIELRRHLPHLGDRLTMQSLRWERAVLQVTIETTDSPKP